MRTLDIIRRAGRSLRNAKTRTILTSLAIAVGAFTITISLAAGEGARQYADKLIGSNVNPQALFIVKDKTLFSGGASQSGLSEYDTNSGTTGRGVVIKEMTQSDVDYLNSRGDLQNVVPIYNPQAKYVQFQGSDKKFVGDVSSYDATIINDVEAGKLPALNTQLGDNDVAVPDSFVKLLVSDNVIKQASDLIGTTIVMTVNAASAQPTADEVAKAFQTGGQAAVVALTQPKSEEISLKIVAVTKQSATALNGSNAFQISTNQARAIAEYTTKGTSSYQKYVGVTALAKTGIKPETIKAALEAKGYAPQTAKDLQSLIFTVVNTLQGIVLGFGIIALIASVFGIINTQYISVLERTREIGLMKALGMRGRHVSRLFQFEAAWIGFLGGVIGALVAVIAGSVLNPIITNALSLGNGTYLLIFQPIPIILMILILMLIAMLAGYFPARKAAKLDPIEALRTE